MTIVHYYKMKKATLALVFAVCTILFSLPALPAQAAENGSQARDISAMVIFQPGKEIQVLKESFEGRMFNPPVVMAPKPDRTLAAVFTAYTSTPDQTDSSPDITADGSKVTDGIIANNCLPFGTKVTIDLPGYENVVLTVHDRMNTRYGCNRFDIWLDVSKKEAKKFGVKRTAAAVYLVKKDLELARR